MRLFNKPSVVVWMMLLVTIAGSLTGIVKSQEEAAEAEDEAPAESPNNAPADAVVAPADSDPAQKADAEEAAGTTDGDSPSEAKQDGDVPANSPPAEDDQSSKPDEEVPAQSQGEAAPPQEIAPPASEDGGVADLQPEKDSAAPEPEVASVEPVGQSDDAAEPEPTKSTVVESAGDNSESNDAATTTVSANENVAPGVPGGGTGTPSSEEERAAIDSTNGGDVPADADASESKEPSASAEAETSPNVDEQPSADSTTPESVHETVSVSEADDAGRLPDDTGLPIEAPAAETATSNDGSAIQVDGEQEEDHTKVTESIESHSPEETVDREDEAMSGTGAGGNEPVIDSASTTTSDGSIVSPTAADSEETPSSSTAVAVVEEIIIPRTVLPLHLENSPMSGTGAGGNEPVIDSASTTTSDGSIVSPTAADSEETPSSSTAVAVVEEIIIPRTVLPLQLENSPETSSSFSGSTGITSQPETMPVAETTVVVIATDVVTTDSRAADAVGGESAVEFVQLTTVMRTVSTDEPTSAPVNLSVVSTVEVPLVTAKIELKQYQRIEHDGKAVAIDIPAEKKNEKELNKLRRAIARAILRARRKANKTISSAVPNEVTLVPVNATEPSVNEVTSHVPRVTDNSELAAATAAGGASVAADVANTGNTGDNNTASRPHSDEEDRVTAEMTTTTLDEVMFVPKLRLRRDITDDESEDDEFSEDELKQAEEEVEFVVGSDGTVAIVATGMNADQLAQVLEEYKNEIAAESDVSISINPSGATALEANESEQPVPTPSVWDVHFPLFLTIIILALLVLLLTVVCCLCARCRNHDESTEKTPVSMEECRPVRHQMTASNPISDDEIVRDEATPMQECPNPSLPRNGGGQHISKHDDDDAWESGVMPLEDYIGTYQNSSVFENTRL